MIEERNSDPSKLDFAFLSDPRFLNAAVTRAQSLLAVVGDPMSLCSVGACRDLWKDYLRRCEKNNGLHGCTLKTVMDFCLSSQPLDPSAPEFTPSVCAGAQNGKRDTSISISSKGRVMETDFVTNFKCLKQRYLILFTLLLGHTCIELNELTISTNCLFYSSVNSFLNSSRVPS